jgi:hypothetical protein
VLHGVLRVLWRHKTAAMEIEGKSGGSVTARKIPELKSPGQLRMLCNAVSAPAPALAQGKH